MGCIRVVGWTIVLLFVGLAVIVLGGALFIKYCELRCETDITTLYELEESFAFAGDKTKPGCYWCGRNSLCWHSKTEGVKNSEWHYGHTWTGFCHFST